MKIRFSKNRIVETFSIYIVLILIPLSILIYQGATSLQNRRQQIEAGVLNELRRVGESFDRDLLIEWRHFLEREKIRRFYHYQPLIVPDQERFQSTGKSVQRSPLYQTVSHLAHLTQQRPDALDPDAPQPSNLSPSLDQVFDQSLVGYFQFDPQRLEMTTPYDPTPTFPTGEKEAGLIERFRNFLSFDLAPSLINQLDLLSKPDIRPSNILVHLKTKRVDKSREPAESFLEPNRLVSEEALDGNALVQVSYYDFTDYNLIKGGEEYLILFRPIVFQDRIVVQGFLFNILLLIQEAQAYLEQLQPAYGSVVVTGERGPQGISMFSPYSFLYLNLKPGDPDKYLQDYRSELNRFWFIMLFLALALAASLIHLGKLIEANLRLDRKKNDFISAITHELKAPLTSVIMYSEMLEEGWVKGKEITYYRYIRFESERLTRLINNILDFSGLERGVFRLKRHPLLLAPFVEETLEPLKIWMDSNNLNLDLDIRGAPYISVDKDSLSQVIYNLIDNTIKYGRTAEQPTLTIIVDEEAAEGVLIIYDNGPGVSKMDEAKVFKKFYRCENELTRENTGTGLGLSLVKELIEGNGGTVSPYKPRLGGFGVKITLPRVMSEATAPSVQPV